MEKPVTIRTEAAPRLAERFGERAFAERLRCEAGPEGVETGAVLPTTRVLRHPFRIRYDAWLVAALRWTGLRGRARRAAAGLRVVYNEVVSPRVPAGLDGLRLLHLSDLHLDLETGVFRPLLERLAGVDYDILVATGDYRDKNRTEESRWLNRFRELMARVDRPAFGVLGNHDRASSVEPIEALGLRLLLNESVFLERGGTRLLIAGVDDPQCFRTDDLSRAGRIRADPATFRLLLAHGPAIHREAAAWFDLYLCGHTHGGQLCLPGGIALVRNGRCPGRMLRGAWRQGAMHGYTSPGVGCCGVPARLFCPPEITIHTLRRR